MLLVGLVPAWHAVTMANLLDCVRNDTVASCEVDLKPSHRSKLSSQPVQWTKPIF